jgi:hypothetical protein
MQNSFKADDSHCFIISSHRPSGMSFWVSHTLYQEFLVSSKFNGEYKKQENSFGGFHEKLGKMVPNTKT